MRTSSATPAGDERSDLHESTVRDLLPARQPQSGSPMHTYTESELEELRRSLPSFVRDRSALVPPRAACAVRGAGDRVDILKPGWATPSYKTRGDSNDGAVSTGSSPLSPPGRWHGAPDLDGPGVDAVRRFRHEVREGRFVGPTNGQCPGFLQCNMVVLREGREAFDFLLFCQRNSQACPLIEVCDVGSPHPNGVARDADLRTDIPRYAIYRNGALEKEVTDATQYWPDDSVAFLIGCSFSVEGALISSGIPLRSADEGKNVPMYRTSLPCRPAGCMRGNMVVSMKPVKAMDIAKEVEITSKFPQAHGAPVCVGCPEAIGIQDIGKPDWGEPVEVLPDELPVFHACGVTPQNVLMASGVSFAITHSAGHMFLCDLPSDAVP
uniref:DUF1445 domain-containing protein n=1 Tax=Trieres chinensis TaxID=1514140 RepID=A0A6U1WVE2_TRICV